MIYLVCISVLIAFVVVDDILKPQPRPKFHSDWKNI